MTEDDVERRSEIVAHLGEEVWPATGRQLIDVALATEAPDRVVSALRSLEPDATFGNVQQMWTTLGGEIEQKRF